MATPNIVPNANNEGRLGKSGLQWLEIRAQSIFLNGVPVATTGAQAFSGVITAQSPSLSSNGTDVVTSNWVRNHLATQFYPRLAQPALTGCIVLASSPQVIYTSIYTPDQLRDLTQQTGMLPIIQVDPTGLYGGSSTLLDDFTALFGSVGSLENTIVTKSDLGHTHVGSEITDADATLGVANTIVRRTSWGGLFGRATSAASSAVRGDATGAGAYGIHGTNTNATGSAGYFTTTATASPGSAITGVASIGSNCPVAVLLQQGSGNYLELRNNTGANDIKFVINPSLDLEWRGVGGTSNTKRIAVGVATSSRVATLPDATGTIVLGDGSGITDASAFRNALGIGSTSNSAFITVTVTSSVSNGYNFSGGAKIALQNAASTTTFQLPFSGLATVTMVDGEGNGISNPGAFRNALNAVNKTGDTFTGTVIIDPASGSTMLQLVGAAGFATTITCNGSAARSIAVPDKNGTFVVTTSGNLVASDISDSTAIGRTILTAVDAAAVKTAIGVDNAQDIGFAHIKITSFATTGTSSGNWEVIQTSSTSLVSGSGFNEAPTTLEAQRSSTYTGSVDRYLVNLDASITSGSTNHVLSLGIFVNGVLYAETKCNYHSSGELQISLNCVVPLANLDVINVRAKDNHHSPADVSVTLANFVLTSLG
jgi:hypothetical protein